MHVSKVMHILSYVVYCNQGKSLSYGGRSYYLDGTPTPNYVRSSWDFIAGRPPVLVDCQHCQQTINFFSATRRAIRLWMEKIPHTKIASHSKSSSLPLISPPISRSHSSSPPPWSKVVDPFHTLPNTVRRSSNEPSVNTTLPQDPLVSPNIWTIIQ